MIESANTDLHTFVAFAHSRLAGEPAMTPEECLALYRAEHPTPESRSADVIAVQEALEGIRNGDRGMPLAEFDREFRAQRNLSDVL